MYIYTFINAHLYIGLLQKKKRRGMFHLFCIHTGVYVYDWIIPNFMASINICVNTNTSHVFYFSLNIPYPQPVPFILCKIVIANVEPKNLSIFPNLLPSPPIPNQRIVFVSVISFHLNNKNNFFLKKAFRVNLFSKSNLRFSWKQKKKRKRNWSLLAS